MTDDIERAQVDALLAALDGEIKARHHREPYKNFTDEERLAAIGQLVGDVTLQGANGSGIVAPLSSEDKDRVNAISLLLIKVRGPGATPQPDLSPTPAAAPPLRPAAPPAEMVPRSPSRFPGSPERSSSSRLEPSPEPPLRDPRQIELEQIWRMNDRRSRVPRQIAQTLDPEVGLGEEAGWRRILNRFLPGETAAEFAQRVAEGHAAGQAARNLFRPARSIMGLFNT
jgi:hypothetical protein